MWVDLRLKLGSGVWLLCVAGAKVGVGIRPQEYGWIYVQAQTCTTCYFIHVGLCLSYVLAGLVALPVALVKSLFIHGKAP